MTDPLSDALRQIETKNRERQSEHEKLRSTPEYQAEMHRLDISLHMFINTLKIGMFAATRHAFLAQNSFFLRMLDEFGASATGASFLIREGVINSARRELRFMLELAVQALFVDQSVGGLTFDKRLVFFSRNKAVRNSSVDNVRDLALEMLSDQRTSFLEYVVKAWAQATAHVHPTPQQITANLSLRDSGIAIGFETTDQLRECLDELLRTEAIIVVLLFHAIGPSFTGDLLVDNLDLQNDWLFHSNIYVAAVDEYFDYKFERQANLLSIKQRRARRLV